LRLGLEFGVKGLDEAPGLRIGGLLKRRPLAWIQGCGGEHRSRHRETVRGEIFEQSERQRKRRDSSRCGGAERFLDTRSFGPDGFQRLGDDRAGAERTGARDKIDQLAPPNRRIVTVLGRLVQDGQQTIVKAHWQLVSLGHTLGVALRAHL
jgi:hypothetical protein